MIMDDCELKAYAMNITFYDNDVESLAHKINKFLKDHPNIIGIENIIMLKIGFLIIVKESYEDF